MAESDCDTKGGGVTDSNDLAATVAAYFDRRSSTYDTGEFHPRLTSKLIEGSRIKEGQTVLDCNWHRIYCYRGRPPSGSPRPRVRHRHHP